MRARFLLAAALVAAPVQAEPAPPPPEATTAPEAAEDRVIGAFATAAPSADGASTAEEALLTVTAPVWRGRVMSPGVELDTDALVDRQPRSVADALRGLPGVTIRPNSRGESVPRVRGSEERQTQVFLDGAPISVPWDGRINLDLIPAGLIGAITVRKGAVPIEYGTNAVAGVVDMTTRRGGPEGEGHGVAGVYQLGTYNSQTMSAVGSFGIGRTDVTLAAGHMSQDALPVADLSRLPYSQDDSGRRTNTQASTGSVFAAIGGELGDAVDWRASVLRFGGSRGIAPESDRDPAVSAPRYWRYPDIDFTQATIGVNAKLAPAVNLNITGWQQWFEQTIDAYRSVDYDRLRSSEHNDDTTTGGRVTLTNPAGPVTLRWSGTAQSTTHVQTDTAFPPGVPGADLTYRQNLFSLGVEADVPVAEGTRFTAGVGYDMSTNPLTGDKPAQPDTSAPAFSLGLYHRFDEHWGLTLTGGRRTRFPSARELFGEALGRFLPNPDLRPETVWLADAELTWAANGVSVTLNPFFARTLDGIAQRVVQVGGQSLRQRYNVSGATSYGIDALAVFPVGESWSFQLAGTALSANADAGTAPFRRQVQRPAYEASAAVDWAPGGLFDVRAELRFIGDAVDLAPDGQEAALPAATELNMRLAVPIIRFDGGTRLMITAAVDNLTNAFTEPQLGLPMPGRIVRMGIRVE
jgi:iron complex outermembrane receptor protein